MLWIESATGRNLPHPEAIGRLAAGRVALLGEQHDKSRDHRFQELAIAGLAAHADDLQVGFEMFPRALRPVLDKWVGGSMSEAEFLRGTRWEEVWGFPPELYLPLFRLCRDLRLPMFGMNVARPVVSHIGRDGWEALPEEYRSWLTPAAPASPAYRRQLFEMTGGVRPGREAQDPEDPAFDRFVRAQGVWDRAFACAIAEACGANPLRKVVGIIGRGHLEGRLGTPEQLADLGLGEVTVALCAEPGAKSGNRCEEIADLCFVFGNGLP
jgi:uncharacterized iron-regulated protein